MTKRERLQHRILQNMSLVLIIVSLIIALVSLVACSNGNPNLKTVYASLNDNDDDNDDDDKLVKDIFKDVSLRFQH